MRRHDLTSHGSRTRRSGGAVALGLLAAFVLSGCQGKLVNGFLPDAITEGGKTVTTLWVGAWIALFAVGALVWGLIFWCVIAYRRKPGDDELPVQLRYNIPIEILYTVVPVFMIFTFFYFTAESENKLVDTSKKPDLTINVVGKQWSWDFNYVDSQVYQPGTQAIMTGQAGDEKTIPTLYLPVGKRVEFVLTARDVIHSFWVPQFLQKLDMIPGRVNKFQVVTTEEGTFSGKCAELCGAYHSQMLFNLKVVSQDEYDKQMEALKAQGLVGVLSNGLNRQQLMPGQERLLPTTGGK